ncbi:hypothetical protein C7212DRAFT_85355, partial [Tuber magnatum]
GDGRSLKSTSGYVSRLGSPGIISWWSIWQPTCMQSMAQVEYLACAHAVMQLEWVRGPLLQIGMAH